MLNKMFSKSIFYNYLKLSRIPFSLSAHQSTYVQFLKAFGAISKRRMKKLENESPVKITISYY